MSGLVELIIACVASSKSAAKNLLRLSSKLAAKKDFGWFAMAT
jgi:hypothetical protein